MIDTPPTAGAVHTDALIRYHQPQPPAPHIFRIGEVQVSLARVHAIDFYPANPPANHQPKG